jgi:tRNA threonylcarbamoyladenosine biosynthesis protein TsaE
MLGKTKPKNFVFRFVFRSLNRNFARKNYPTMEIRIQTLGDLQEAARQFVAAMQDRKIFAFYGAMGAGKTTFIKALCEALGVTDQVTSPTFAIVNEYQGREPIYHFDFYRIKRLEEAYDLGFEEYCYSGRLCLIEWPELIEELLPDDTVRVTIDVLPDGSRTVSF